MVVQNIADETNAAAAAINSATAATQATGANTKAATIQTKTDNLPASPAAVGSQMDLVNAPNATAITAIQSGLATATNLATLAAKFTGITLLAQWLGAAFGKQTPNSTALTEINATGAGSGTFAGGASDSLEALKTKAAAIQTKTDQLTFTVPNHIDATATADSQAIADAVVAALTESGVTVDEASIAAIGATISATLASTKNITVSRTQVNGTTLNLIKGDDYLSADGRQLVFTLTDSLPSFEGASVLFTLAQGFTKAGSVVTATGDTRVVSIDLTSANTTTFNTGGQSSGQQEFAVSVTLANGHVITVVKGMCRTRERAE